MKIGVISDTHHELDNAVFSLFEGAEAVIHAGDAGSMDILADLGSIAPVYAVHGNIDNPEVSNACPSLKKVKLGGIKFLIAHDIGTPDKPRKEILSELLLYKPDAVIFGHTHRPFSEARKGVLFFNPGSSQSGRDKAPRSVGIIEIRRGAPVSKHIILDQPS